MGGPESIPKNPAEIDQAETESLAAETEEVLATVHALSEPGAVLNGDVLMRLEQLAHQGSHALEVGHYEHGIVPRLEDLENGSAFIVSKLEDALHDADSLETESIQKLIAFFKGRPEQLRYAIFSYADSVARFYRISRSRSMMDNEDFLKQMKVIDQTRRRRHDSLLDSLAGYSQQISSLIQDGYLEREDVAWFDFKISDSTDSSGEENAPHRPVLAFSSGSITDRDRVRNWAVALDVVENIREQERLLEERKEMNR